MVDSLDGEGAMRRWTSCIKTPAAFVLGVSGLCLLVTALAVLAQTPQPQNAPAALAKCQQCHGDKLQMSHLSLTSRDAMLKGGDHGASIVPGNAEESLLYKRITGQVQPAMPMAPIPALTTEEIASIKDWINAGAPMS